MNISFNWLKDLIDIDLSVDETAKSLTRVGLAVEGIHPHKDDFVLDIDLTSNRPDCLSHLGIARELGATLGKPLRLAEKTPEAPMPPVLSYDIVKIEDADLCHRFTARIIRNVKVGPSPQWLVDRLEAVGERSINNIADITNYVMLELGQPMHAFDLDKLDERRIVVRRARAGETIKTLDEVERELYPTMLAICDAKKPVAIGGVMGGLDSSITDETVNVLLEVAYFKRGNIRATSRTLGLTTEASYRFERGVDIQNLSRASDRATDLICELAGAEKGDFIDIYPTKFVANEVKSPAVSAAVKRLTGLTVDPAQCIKTLDLLGIRTPGESGDTATTFISPSWRHDIAIEEDLVEEVARHTGYEKIGSELPPAFGAGEYQATEYRKRSLRQALTDVGFDEGISYSFIDTKHDEVFGSVPGLINDAADEKHVTLQDAVIEGAVRMRHSILPGLLDAVRLNLNHQRRDLKLFEIGKVFAARSTEDPLPIEVELFSLAITGSETNEGKALPVRDLDFYDAKGAVEMALAAAGVGAPSFDGTDVKHLRRGQTAAVHVDGKEIGYVGRLADEIAAQYKFKTPVYVAEIDLAAALAAPQDAVGYQALAKYPSVTRDVSLLAGRDVTFETIRQGVKGQDFELCRNVSFVDVYEGKGLADGERSITIRIEYRSHERTLIEDEVDAMHQQILAGLEQKLGVKPRA